MGSGFSERPLSKNETAPFDRKAGGVLLRVRASPKSARDQVGGLRLDADGRAWLLVRTRAAPSDGAANKAIQALLAHALNLAPTAIRLERGRTSREKIFAIAGDRAALATRLDQLTAR